MFGYVNVYKDELKIKDYDTYRAYYCGLCKMLGKRHNALARLSLNYDLTFLAVLSDSLCENPHSFEMSGCIKRLGKRKTVTKARGLEFAADMNVLLAYFKLKDDITDNGSVKAMLAILPFWLQIRKIKKDYPKLYESVDIALKRLAFIEDSKCDIIDKAAHEFANLMQSIFETADSSLKSFGYVLGRLIYILDVYDDLEQDYKENKYNPAIYQYGYKGSLDERTLKMISDNLYNSLGTLANEYQKIPIKKNKEIIDNIIYLGLRAKCDFIINERKKSL